MRKSLTVNRSYYNIIYYYYYTSSDLFVSEHASITVASHNQPTRKLKLALWRDKDGGGIITQYDPGGQCEPPTQSFSV